MADPALVAAYKMLLDQDDGMASLAEALESRDHIVINKSIYNYLWSNTDAPVRPAEAIKAKARSRKSNAAKDKAKGETKTKRGKE
jgi:hypothetical protein